MKNIIFLALNLLIFQIYAQPTDSTTTIKWTKGQIAYLKNGNQVLITPHTNEIISEEYDQIDYFPHPLFKVERNGFYGLIDTLGSVIIPIKYKHIETFFRDFTGYGINGGTFYYLIQNEAGKYGIWNQNRLEIAPCIYDRINTEMKGMMIYFEYLHQKKEDVYNFYERGNESQVLLDSLLAIEKSIPNSLFNLYNDFIDNPFFVVHKNDSNFVINAENKTLLSFASSKITYLNSKMIRIHNDKGVEVIVFTENDTTSYHYDTTQVSFENSSEIIYRSNSHLSRYILTLKDGKFGIIDSYSGIIFPPTYDLIENCYFHVDLDSRCGYFASPTWLENYHKENYRFYQLRHENGLLRFKLNGKTGVFSTDKMKEVFPAVYDSIMFKDNYFNNQIQIIRLNDQWVLYSKTKEEILFESADEISPVWMRWGYDRQFYAFKEGDRYGILDDIGTIVEKPKYDSITIDKKNTCLLYKKGKFRVFAPR